MSMTRPRSILEDRKSTRLNSSHRCISYAVFCLKKKTNTRGRLRKPDGGARHAGGGPSSDTLLDGSAPGPVRPPPRPAAGPPFAFFFFFKEPGPPRVHPFSPPRPFPD